MKIGAVALAMTLVASAVQAAPQKATPSPSASGSPDAGASLLPGSNSKDPVFIEADRLFYSEKDSKAIYSGNVVLIQGPTKLTCSVMVLFLDKASSPANASVAKAAAASASIPSPSPNPGPSASAGAASASQSSQVRHMDCAGPVTIVSKTQTATGDSAQYDKPQNKAWLIGHVTLSDGPNVTKGDKLTYDLATGQALVETNSTSGKPSRVQSQFIPNSNSDSASPAPGATQAAKP